MGVDKALCVPIWKTDKKWTNLNLCISVMVSIDIDETRLVVFVRKGKQLACKHHFSVLVE